MNYILYYSNYCEHSKKLLQEIVKTDITKDIHFLCIDKRIKGRDGATYIVLENNQHMILPPNISNVPALLLLNDNNKIATGDDIKAILKPAIKQNVDTATFNNGEPESYVLGSSGSYSGVHSDSFSYLDTSSDDLSAKGGGGLRQLHNHTALTLGDETMNTPSEDSVPNKVSDHELESYEQQRNTDLQQFGSNNNNKI